MKTWGIQVLRETRKQLPFIMNIKWISYCVGLASILRYPTILVTLCPRMQIVQRSLSHFTMEGTLKHRNQFINQSLGKNIN